MGFKLIGVAGAIAETTVRDRIFGLDINLIGQTALVLLSVCILFAALSYLLFEPVKNVLAKRTEKIKQDITQAAEIKRDAVNLQAEYDQKMKQVDKEVEEILSAARKKSLAQQKEIIQAAEKEAARIIERANLEIEREKEQIKDDIRKEIIDVATVMASKFVAHTIDEKTKEHLIDQTLLSMGENTWLN